MVIETERLLLREWKIEDADELVEGLNNFDTAKGLTVPFPYCLEDAKEFIEKHQKHTDKDFYFAVTLKENGKVVGGTSLNVKGDNLKEGGGGIWIAEAYTGIGLGSEVWRARAKLAFETLGLETLTNGFYEYNERSRHMQLKCGAKIIGEKIGNCPAMGGTVREILVTLSKEDFYKNLNK